MEGMEEAAEALAAAITEAVKHGVECLNEAFKHVDTDDLDELGLALDAFSEPEEEEGSDEEE